MNDKVEGIVLSEINYGDTSKILNIFTKKYGIIGVMSKGCKTLKSDLRSVSAKMTYGLFNIHYKEGKLSTLISADLINNFKNIKKDLLKISACSYLMNLTEQVIKQCYDNRLYDLLISGLIKIEESYDPLVITNIIELKYLDFLGVLPCIDSCTVCGSINHIVTISSDIGGYVCKKCHKNEPIVNELTIKYVRMFYYVDLNKITVLKIKDEAKKEINSFLDKYYEKYTGLYLKSKVFLNNMLV